MITMCGGEWRESVQIMTVSVVPRQQLKSYIALYDYFSHDPWSPTKNWFYWCVTSGAPFWDYGKLASYWSVCRAVPYKTTQKIGISQCLLTLCFVQSIMHTWAVGLLMAMSLSLINGTIPIMNSFNSSNSLFVLKKKVAVCVLNV